MLSGQNEASVSLESLCRVAGRVGTESQACSPSPRAELAERAVKGPSGLSFFPFLSPPLAPGGKPASSGPLGFY